MFWKDPAEGGVVEELQRDGPQRVGPYRLVGRLGGGGMGQVFLGRSTGGRLVAVKVIRDDWAADPEFRVRFRREVAAARRVGGLFTALVVEADVEAPKPWLATAYVAGPSLADAVSRYGPLPPESVLSLAAGLAEGLGAIHAVGLVHRDLKPSNILLADDGPRVIDFGISRAAEASVLTGTGLVVGSPGFMSPEQAEGGEVGAASDMFSLGAVLVFAATGVGPFGTGSTAALLYRVVHSSPKLEDVPPQVRPIAERCLAKDPGQRPTPAELLAEFGDIDLPAIWLPTRILEGFTQYAPPATAPDAPRTVTAPRYSDSAQVREWAKQRGVEVNPRGQIKKEILEQYYVETGKGQRTQTAPAKGNNKQSTPQSTNSPPAQPPPAVAAQRRKRVKQLQAPETHVPDLARLVWLFTFFGTLTWLLLITGTGITGSVMAILHEINAPVWLGVLTIAVAGVGSLCLIIFTLGDLLDSVYLLFPDWLDYGSEFGSLLIIAAIPLTCFFSIEVLHRYVGLGMAIGIVLSVSVGIFSLFASEVTKKPRLFSGGNFRVTVTCPNTVASGLP